MKTWFNKTHNSDDKTFLKGELLKESHGLRTKKQIWEIAKNLTDVTRNKDCRMKRIAAAVCDRQRAHLMAALNLERASTSGGFFPQAGTNLTTPGSRVKSIVKKSVQKQDQGQQTSPMSVPSPVLLFPTPPPQSTFLE